MCGLLGASSNKPLDIDRVKILYLLNKERGEHACGFSSGDKVFKQAIEPEKFITNVLEGDDNFNKEFTSFIGHTRYATVGDAKKSANAHPFYFKDKLIGTHNGTIRNIEELQEIFDTNYDVDSEFIYYLLTKFPLKKITSLIQGSMALAFHDLQKKEINIYRFGRPLYYGRTDEHTLWYSSQEKYLEAIDCDDIKEVPIHTHIKLKNGRIISSKNLKKDDLPTPDDKTYSKRVTLDLYKERSVELRSLKDSNVDLWLKVCGQLEEEKKKKDEEEKKKESRRKRRVTKAPPVIPADASLLEDVPQTAHVIEKTEKDGKPILYYYWFDATDFSTVYIKKGNSITEMYDMKGQASCQVLGEDFPEIFDEVTATFEELESLIELRMKYELS